ncbi:hypothetical protein HS088_TW14G01070 [Tripterygium wilfordii]|uniref:Peroxidase n=1 Tax=Tripterygium wilfordii TaxID=458696 RepID=A0A7J7CS39_TRIWF|nr:hypothetical protein HS088_TW14G01070 [Tripterygium wilfordii]
MSTLQPVDTYAMSEWVQHVTKNNFNTSLWEVLTGRRDGTISRQSEAQANIPTPFFNFATLKKSFASKGLTVHDLVVLSAGGHTIGVGHCNFFSNRLYNFTGKGDQDPSLDPTYAATLKSQCKTLTDNTTFVPMDPGTPLSFDANYYKIVKLNQGLFQSDAALLTNKGASNIVDELTNSNKFFTEFAQSMKRMGAIEVLTGSAGEIRKKTLYASLLVLLLTVSVVAQDWNGHGPEPRKGKGDHGPNKKENGLKMMFYERCSHVETIVRDITWSKVADDSTLAAKLLRLHYHDCFVRVSE